MNIILGQAYSSQIDYSFDKFSVCSYGGDAKLIDDGWSFWFTSGVPCGYHTRGLQSVRNAVARTRTIRNGRQRAKWIASPRTPQDEKEMREYEGRREILVESARSKLTEDEFNAVVEEGRDP